MMKLLKIIFPFLLIALVSGFVYADRLPSEVPENQIFSIDTTISAFGIIEDMSSLKWAIVNRGAIPEGRLGYKQIIAESIYEDSLLTNGGKFREVRNFDFASENKGRTRYNIASEKLLTYASVHGAHLVGGEEYTLSDAGNWSTRNTDTIRCIFTTDDANKIPAFCNIVSAKSNIINLNSAKISTRGQIRSVGSSSSIPAGLRYRMAVTPDESYGTGFAEGTIKTVFAGSIMEGRNIDDYYDSTGMNEPYYSNTWNKTSVENTWKDATQVTGGIRKLQKTFSYNSGIKFLF